MGCLDFLTSTRRPAAKVTPALPERVKEALMVHGGRRRHGRGKRIK